MDLITLGIIILFLIGIALASYVGYRIGAFKRDRFWKDELPSHRKDAIVRSRAVLSGQFSEQLAPYLPDFGFNPTECRFVGKPVDFLVFKGLDNKSVDEVIFVEVKSGKSKLNPVEKSLKDAVEKKKVRWVEYNVPEGLTKQEFVNFDEI